MKPEDMINILKVHNSMWGLPRNEEGRIPEDISVEFLKQAYLQLSNFTSGLLIGLTTKEEIEDVAALLKDLSSQPEGKDESTEEIEQD